jgi:hypothetical protein
VEYAVKASGHCRNKSGFVAPDWNSYCASITTDFCANPSRGLKRHLNYITSKPPKKLVKLKSGQLKWKDRHPDPAWSGLRKTLFLAQGVRNNVVHGSKFTAGESPELNRNAKLMAAATAILSTLLDYSYRTREVFHGVAP